MIQGTPKQGNTIVGEVCGVTKETNYQKGYSDGYDKGYKEGEYVGKEEGAEENYNRGYENGYAEGQDAGYTTGMQQGYAKGHNDGKAEGYEEGYNDAKAEEEWLFTYYGIPYKRNMVVGIKPLYGFGERAYMYAYEMESFSAPEANMNNSITGNVFRYCEKLKTVYLPKIRRIGNVFFGNCTALEEVTLGCEEVPMAQIQPNAFTGCSALVRLNLVGEIEASHSYADSPLLDVDSCRNIAYSLADLTGKTAQTLTVHPAVGARMVEWDLDSIIRNKNWTLVY